MFWLGLLLVISGDSFFVKRGFLFGLIFRFAGGVSFFFVYRGLSFVSRDLVFTVNALCLTNGSFSINYILRLVNFRLVVDNLTFVCGGYLLMGYSTIRGCHLYSWCSLLGSRLMPASTVAVVMYSYDLIRGWLLSSKLVLLTQLIQPCISAWGFRC